MEVTQSTHYASRAPGSQAPVSGCVVICHYHLCSCRRVEAALHCIASGAVQKRSAALHFISVSSSAVSCQTLILCHIYWFVHITTSCVLVFPVVVQNQNAAVSNDSTVIYIIQRSL